MTRKYPKPPGSPAVRAQLATLTHAQVAFILGITPNAVLETEARAIAKLAAHPLLRELAADLELLFESGPASPNAP